MTETPTNFKTLLQRSTIILFVGAMLVAVAYWFIDRPVARLVHDQQINHIAALKWVTYLPTALERLAVLLLVWCAVRLAWRQLNRLETVLLTSAVCLYVANGIRFTLAYVFGRYWPMTWIDNNPALIPGGEYGFHPFHSGTAFESFPSGHTARIVAVMTVFWLAYPRWRLLYFLTAAAVMISLIGMDYHFVGDVMGGLAIGMITGMYGVAILACMGKCLPHAGERRISNGEV